MKTKTIVQEHKKNFETLRTAFKNNDVCLMDCIEKSTGEHVAVICAMNFIDAKYEIVPMAKFFNDNPYELLLSPMEYENIQEGK